MRSSKRDAFTRQMPATFYRPERMQSGAGPLPNGGWDTTRFVCFAVIAADAEGNEVHSLHQGKPLVQ